MKLFVTFAAEEEVRFVVLVEPSSSVASLRQKILADFRSVFPSRLPLCFFRIASEDGFFLTDAAAVGQVLADGGTVTCHRADAEVAGAPLPEQPSAEEMSGIFATFRAQVSYVASAVCHAAAKAGSEAAGDAMSILLAMLMLRGPQLSQARLAAFEALQKSLPSQDGASLPAFLGAGGIFVLLGMLSPSTKLESEPEVERAAQLFTELVQQHGTALAPVLEDCHPGALLQKLAKDSRCSAKTKQHALAGRRALERAGHPPRARAESLADRRLQSAGAAVAHAGDSPGRGHSRSSSERRTPTPLLPGGVTLRMLLDQGLSWDSAQMRRALSEFEAKVANSSEVALRELAADSGCAEVVARSLRSRAALPLGSILARLAGDARARSTFAQLFSKYLRFAEAVEAAASWPPPLGPLLAVLEEELLQAAKVRPVTAEITALLALLNVQVAELQAFGLRMMRKLLDPNTRLAADAAREVSPKAINQALSSVMPTHPLACLDILGTLALKEDFRNYFSSQLSLLKFLARCCQPDKTPSPSGDQLAVQRAASRCLAHLASLPAVRDWARKSALQGLHASTSDLTVRAYIGIALGLAETER